MMIDFVLAQKILLNCTCTCLLLKGGKLVQMIYYRLSIFFTQNELSTVLNATCTLSSTSHKVTVDSAITEQKTG